MAERVIVDEELISSLYDEVTAKELFEKLPEKGKIKDIVKGIMRRYKLTGRDPVVLSEVTGETWIVAVKRDAGDFDAGIVGSVWPVPKAVILTSGSLAGPLLEARWQMISPLKQS